MKAITSSMHGMIDRRMLINFRVRPDVASQLLPPFFRSKRVNGWAMAGICLIRLKEMRPPGFPAVCGLTSENAAHRIAVEWDDGGIVREGVYIPRRDTSSALQAFAGGWLFPGVHHVSTFEVKEGDDEFRLQMRSCDGTTSIGLLARRATQMPAASVFASLADASEFFSRGAMGYSDTDKPDCCDGLELHTSGWQLEPLEIQWVSSSFFDNRSRFPKGTIQFDSALLMQNIEHEWRVLPCLERK
jgi:hypothetical protein